VKAFIADRIGRLGDTPVRHRMIAQLGVHALYLGRYPYIVYYRVRRDEIAIVHIRHAGTAAVARRGGIGKRRC
jgi:plasmid stabilization system protein ParE